jgi:vacuolar iron transporter family protein
MSAPGRKRLAKEDSLGSVFSLSEIAQMAMAPSTKHFVTRLGWLRAAVLGANDGLLSTASLMIGVASAEASHDAIVLAGMAGLVAGAMSMAAGEYVSVSSQSDSEAADIARERRELRDDRAGELRELTGIYVERGLDEPLARQVAEKLMKYDALQAHTRDELGISDATAARPAEAALTSAASFAVGASVPFLTTLVAPRSDVVVAIAIMSLVSLAVLGAVGAKAGGATMAKAAIRVTFWGALAMAVTAGIGMLFGTQV